MIEKEAGYVDQKLLVCYLCEKLWYNTSRTELSGKKSIRYCPVGFKTPTFVRSTVGKTVAGFLSCVYNISSNLMSNQHGTLDSNSEDRIMYQTLADVEHNFGKVNLIASDQSLD